MLWGLTSISRHYQETMVTWRRKPLKDLIDRCFRCGLCRAVCPVFLQVGEEPAVARGKLQLIAALSEDRLKPTENLAHLLTRCLICGACEGICPADVEVTEAILRVRAELAQSLDIHRPQGPLASPSLVRWHQYLQAIRSRQQRPLTAVLELLSDQQPEHVPEESGKDGLAERPHYLGSAHARMKMGYFPGCAEVLWPRLGQSIARLLEKVGVQVLIPGGLSCCGHPFVEGGDLTTARCLANENIKAFEKLDVEAIVVGCSTGKRMLERYGRGLLGLTGFLLPVYGLGDFLAHQAVLPEPWAPVSAKVCYLPPRGFGRSPDGTLELLSKVPDLELILLEDDQGCGESLFFAYLHPELSEKILGRMVDAVTVRGCQAVVTESPLLMCLLDRYLQSHGSDLRVVHLAEILELACGGADFSARGMVGESGQSE